MAGSDMTASPSQLVARTQSRDTAEGLKATAFQDSSGPMRARPSSRVSELGVGRKIRQRTSLAENLVAARRLELRTYGL